jgi:hypothetical protein
MAGGAQALEHGAAARSVGAGEYGGGEFGFETRDVGGLVGRGRAEFSPRGGERGVAGRGRGRLRIWRAWKGVSIVARDAAGGQFDEERTGEGGAGDECLEDGGTLGRMKTGVAAGDFFAERGVVELREAADGDGVEETHAEDAAHKWRGDRAGDFRSACAGRPYAGRARLWRRGRGLSDFVERAPVAEETWRSRTRGDGGIGDDGEGGGEERPTRRVSARGANRGALR